MSDIRSYFAKKSITSTEKSPAGVPDPCRPLSRDVPYKTSAPDKLCFAAQWLVSMQVRSMVSVAVSGPRQLETAIFIDYLTFSL